jgi:hypothetical protein
MMGGLRLTGTLGRDAEFRTSTDGTAWVYVEVHQGPGTIAAAGRRCMGRGPAAQIAARNAAHHLRSGTRVCVHADGYSIAHSPSLHLVLDGISHIEQLSLPRPRRSLQSEAA